MNELKDTISNEIQKEEVCAFIDLASLKLFQLLRNTISVHMIVSYSTRDRQNIGICLFAKTSSSLDIIKIEETGY